MKGRATRAGLALAGRLPRERLKGWAGQLRRGAALVPGALLRLSRDPGLRGAAVLPTLLTVLGCAGMAAAATAMKDEEVGAGWFAHLHTFMVTFVALASMPPTLLTRSWTKVALEARRALGLGAGEDPHAGRSWLSVVMGEWVKAGRQTLVVVAGLAPLLLLLWVAPDGTWALLGGIWAFYWVVVDAFELPIEILPGPPPAAPRPWFTRGLSRLGGRLFLLWPARWAGRLAGRLSRPWAEEIHFTERNPWECLGFGLAAGVLLAVPLLGLVFRAVVIVGATELVGELCVEAEPAGDGGADGRAA